MKIITNKYLLFFLGLVLFRLSFFLTDYLKSLIIFQVFLALVCLVIFAAKKIKNKFSLINNTLLLRRLNMKQCCSMKRHCEQTMLLNEWWGSCHEVTEGAGNWIHWAGRREAEPQAHTCTQGYWDLQDSGVLQRVYPFRLLTRCHIRLVHATHASKRYYHHRYYCNMFHIYQSISLFLI